MCMYVCTRSVYQARRALWSPQPSFECMFQKYVTNFENCTYLYMRACIDMQHCACMGACAFIVVRSQYVLYFLILLDSNCTHTWGPSNHFAIAASSDDGIVCWIMSQCEDGTCMLPRLHLNCLNLVCDTECQIQRQRESKRKTARTC